MQGVRMQDANNANAAGSPVSLQTVRDWTTGC